MNSKISGFGAYLLDPEEIIKVKMDIT